MVRALCVILAIILVVVILGTIGYIGIKTAGYMINQNFDFQEAFAWAKDDYLELITGIFEPAKGEANYFEYGYTVNKYIEVKGCIYL